MRTNVNARAFYSGTDEEWHHDCNELKKDQVYERRVADMLLYCLAAYFNVNVIVLNTNKNFGGKPITAVPATVVGGKKLLSQIQF
jgi:hypothetical protein